MKTPLLGLSPAELQHTAEALGLPRRTGAQLAKWMYIHQADSLSLCTDLSKEARRLLDERYTIGCAAPVRTRASADGTVKHLFPTLQGGHYVETVFIPEGERGTVCLSSQVGCKMGCAFCMTGRQGFEGQLSAADILNQLYSLPERGRVTNIVFMGQGEPMDNIDNVLAAIRALTAPWGYAFSPRRITVSTVGIKKGLPRFLDECECHLAVSLHHPGHAGRMAIVPAERAFPIADIVALLSQYDFCAGRRDRRSPLQAPLRTGELSARQRRLSFEYILLAGVNDSEREAEQLIKLLRPLAPRARVNLIPFHAFPKAPLQGAGTEALMRFRDRLTRSGFFATVRASRGQDIEAACGMLNTAALPGTADNTPTEL